MKIQIQETNASLKRRLELQGKILRLLEKYDDVPILVCHRLNVTGKRYPLIDLTQPGSDHLQANILSKCHFKVRGFWQSVKEFFSFDNSCPECGGQMNQVKGWDKEQCIDCNYTRRTW